MKLPRRLGMTPKSASRIPGSWSLNQFLDPHVLIFDDRFLVVVLSAYKQMRLQSTAVLGDLDSENFDEAFDMFRPGV